MASITSTGIGSGLDIGGLVQQLVAAERQPSEIRFAQQEARAQSRISAYGSLKSALDGLRTQLEKMQDPDTFLVYQASSSDEERFTATTSVDAQPGVYDVEVQQLATVQKLESGAFADADAVVGTGTLTIKAGTESFSVLVDDDNNTAAGIRDAINDAVDNTGVAATIVNTDGGSYLTLTGTETGADQAIVVTQSGGDGGLSVLEYDPDNLLLSLTEVQAALNAQVEINGRLVTSDNNSIAGAIDGVTINLAAAAPGEVGQLSVSNDTGAVKAQADAFINAYNTLIDTFDKLTSYNIETRQGAALVGDSTLRGVRDQLRREMTVAVDDIEAGFESLSDIGIETGLDGKLSLDSAVFDAAVGPEFAKFGQLFANEDGYAVRLGTIADRYLDDTDGILKARLDGLDETIERVADQRERLNARMVTVESRLLRQFNALDALVSNLTTTSNFLTQQLQNLPKISVRSS